MSCYLSSSLPQNQQQLSENQTWPEKRKGYLQLHRVAFQTLMTLSREQINIVISVDINIVDLNAF